AHKLLPSSGQGAVNAMQDAVILANCIYEMNDATPAAITEALKSFKDQRYQHCLSQYEASKTNAKISYGQKWWERLIRHIVFNYLPDSVQKKNIARDLSYRPQASFLPQVPNHGTSPASPQKPSQKYAEYLKKQQEQQQDGNAAAAL
ncbi:hypothetical protein BGZ50_000650, partial [Haplosporangium sp. Z 11]